MAAGTVLMRPTAQSNTPDEEFLDFSREISAAFVDLYLLEETVNERSVILRSPEERERGKTLLVCPDGQLSQEASDKAREVARRLRVMGDEMDKQIQEKIEKAMKELITRQSIWEVGYSQFSGACQGILTSCQGLFRNGWDQVSTVYLTSSRLIAELRVQQYQRGGPREEHMRGFAGNFIVSSGIQEWTEMQGGISAITTDTLRHDQPHLAKIRETEV